MSGGGREVLGSGPILASDAGVEDRRDRLGRYRQMQHTLEAPSDLSGGSHVVPSKSRR